MAGSDWMPRQAARKQNDETEAKAEAKAPKAHGPHGESKGSGGKMSGDGDVW
jgi:hypothetical protein